MRIHRAASYVFAAAVLMLAGHARAQIRDCAFEAYVADRDPAGARLHAAPNARSPVVQRLAMWPSDKIPGRHLGHTLAISGQSGEWYRVVEAGREDAGSKTPDWTGESYIHRSRIRVLVRRESRLYAGPDGSLGIAGIVKRAVAAAPLACRERSLRVSIATSEGRVEGWLNEESWCAMQTAGCALGAAD